MDHVDREMQGYYTLNTCIQMGKGESNLEEYSISFPFPSGYSPVNQPTHWTALLLGTDCKMGLPCYWKLIQYHQLYGSFIGHPEISEPLTENKTSLASLTCSQDPLNSCQEFFKQE